MKKSDSPKQTRQYWAIFLGLLMLVFGSTANAQTEPPLLIESVKKGELPPMIKRLPVTPHVTRLGEHKREPGQYGGEIRMVMADQRDLRMMSLYGYSRLIVFNEKQQLEPDILEDVHVEDGRRFTLTIREGHRWSDGALFTTEDFRYWWEDVANNKLINAGGPPMAMMADEKLPAFEILDERRVRFSWASPNPSFLPALAGAQPTYIYLPSHYMKRFHERYADTAKLEQDVKAHRVKDWRALHEQKSRLYRNENPELPTLEPWRNRTAPPAERFIFERNPYFHRVDENGQQLPYIDRVIINTATGSLIPTKVGAGDSDLQVRYLSFDNYTFLKTAEKQKDFTVKLWRNAEGARLAIYPNLNTSDLVWRTLLRDVRVRRAFSVAINRRDINNVIFYGLAKESANTLIAASPLSELATREAWSQHNPRLANTLLDQAGLDKRDWDGIRLLPDGRRAEVTIEGSGEKTDETDSVELIIDNFRDIGIRLFYRSAQRELFRRRILIGETILSLWQGLDNALAGPDMEPDALAPSNRGQYQWPRFGQYVETMGRAGEAVDMPEVKKLSNLLETWRRSSSREERENIWRNMLNIHAENVFSIGIVNSTLQPVVVSRRLRNVPDNGWYSFEPGAFLGVYRPDTFWLTDPERRN
jgi:peptide/nickel transport system substrate-binding protein